MRLAPLLLPLCLAASPHAQVIGDCALGRAHAFLDMNEVEAHVYNNGALFYGPETNSGDG